MKKRISFVAITLIAALFLSCENKDEVKVGDETKGVITKTDGKTKDVSLIPSVFIYDSEYLWFENSKGNLEASKSLMLSKGQALFAYPTDDGSESEEAFEKKMIIQSNKKSYSFIKVRYDDNDYWVLSNAMALNTTPVVVITQAIKYTDPDLDAVTSTKIPEGTIVALHSDYSSNPENDQEYVKITARVNDKNHREIYLKKETVSDKPDDVVAARILKKISSEKSLSPVVEAELRKDLHELDLSSYFASKINN